MPAGVVLVLLTAPVGDVEGRVRHDVVEPLIRVLVAGEAVCRLLAEIRCKRPDRQVHRRQSPGGGVALLAIDGDVIAAATVGGHEVLAGDEHAAGAAAGVVVPALVGREHRHQQIHTGGWPVELAPFLPSARANWPRKYS